MERRTALALAAATAGTALASSAAFAINIGLLRHDADKPVGILSSKVIDASFGTDPTQVTVAVEDPAGGRDDAAELDDPSRTSSTASPSGAANTTDGDNAGSDDRGADDRPAPSTVPGHDDDD